MRTVAEAELAVLTPPRSRLSPDLNRAVVERERLRSRRSRERSGTEARDRGRESGANGAGQRRDVAPGKLAGLAGGEKGPVGRGGRAVLPSGSSRRGVSAGSAGGMARSQAARTGGQTNFEAGPAPRRHSLARARSRSGTGRAHAAGEKIQRGAGAAPLARGAGAQRAPEAGRLDPSAALFPTSAIARVLPKPPRSGHLCVPPPRA